MKKTTSQKAEVLKYLKTHKGITPYVAYERFGITRLADIILRLRKDGYMIFTEMITTKNRYGHVVSYAKYSLDS